MWVELYPGPAADIGDALAEGPVVVSGLPGSGRAPVVRELLGDHPIIEIRPCQAGTLGGLTLDLLNSLLFAFSTFPEPGTPRDFNVFIATAFGRSAQDVLDGLKRGDASQLSMSQLLAALPPRAGVIVHDAHLLPALSDRVLWAIRARVQEPHPPRVALLTREWHRGDLVGPDAAFFGFAQVFDLPVPHLFEWMRDHNVEDLEWLLEQTRGLPRPTLATLDRARNGQDVHAAWRVEVHESRRVAEEMRRLAHGLHPYAPRLLAAIAADDRDYASVPGARTDAIASALRLMRDADVIYQPRPRKWLVADPAVVPHLAASSTP
jgi:hypothetical protein